MKTFFLTIYISLILTAAKRPTLWEKLQYCLKVVGTLAPVAAALELLHYWFTSNSNFIAGVVIALVLNMIIGMCYHLKMGTFDWAEFFVKNIIMFAVVFAVYILLELLRFAMGDNVIGEGFKIIVQTTTILYPVSKALKNIHILTNKKHPPAAIMDRLYNFEKKGRLKDLYDQNENQNETE